MASLTRDPTYDEIAYVMVGGGNVRGMAEQRFALAGADLSKVEFLTVPTDSIWVRDYGPAFIEQEGNIGIVDAQYYPGRPRDNFVPVLLGEDHWDLTVDQLGLDHSGGNLLTDHQGRGFLTSRIFRDNPRLTSDMIGELYLAHQGLGWLHLFPTFPKRSDQTGHVDMWMSLVDEDTVVISDFRASSNHELIRITEEAAENLESMGYEVFRTPAFVGLHSRGQPAHFTYTNVLRLNRRIFIPSYGLGDSAHLERDAQAFAVWSAAAPDAEIVPLDCFQIIWAAGALHCIAIQVPLYASTVPAVHMTSPQPGDVLASWSPAEITWESSDDQGITSVDIYLSRDGGSSYPDQVASGIEDDGHQYWWVPQLETDRARMKVVVEDGEGHLAEAISGLFSIGRLKTRVYSFGTGSGEDKWVWGYKTEGAWDAIDRTPVPLWHGDVISSFQPRAYSRITSADSETKAGEESRYDSPWPGRWGHSTHLFEFTIEEEPSSIAELTFIWEGYADQASQMELYVWDDAQEQWGDGKGRSGENRYMDNGAGLRDFRLEGSIASAPERYLLDEGRIRFLLYSERPNSGSHHDYAALIVSHRDRSERTGWLASPVLGHGHD